jgi:hypothetical protein
LQPDRHRLAIVAGALAENVELVTFLGNVLNGSKADHAYAVDFMYIVDVWQRQQEFYQSEFYRNHLLEIQQRQQASASASGP